MRKMKFEVGHKSGECKIVEALSPASAIKASGWLKSEVWSVVKMKPAPSSWCSLVEGGKVKVAFPGGAEMIGSEEAVNAIFSLMGHHPIAVRVNMMSKGKFIEAAGTPGYCSPSSEAYWSM